VYKKLYSEEVFSTKRMFEFSPNGYKRQILSCTSLFFGRVATAMLPHHASFKIKFAHFRSFVKFQTYSNKKWLPFARQPFLVTMSF